ncbi:MAG: hypothetical protein S4CHLAM45_10550 [Chlamydiales bacterium]|nr:hypothetical protein [Chlamydiales bacterium]MCH9619549.1 hypothetical protein [Chlamydiales bacterium]MCH9623155.1 hypothetical protein [Chlamydiales bacterium]
MFVGFFTPITYNNPCSCREHFLGKVDAYFYLGGLKAEVILESEGRNEVKLVEGSSSLLSTSLKIVSYCTVIIPLVILAFKVALRSFETFHIQQEDQRIKGFWEEHIASFYIAHGTTSLFHTHFKTYGISSCYPPALADIITRIRNVWENHKEDIVEKTNYFKWFEERYDKANSSQQVEISFTADPFRQQEYTRGARGGGGEWIRELKHFISNVEQSTHRTVLTADEAETVLEMEMLIEAMQQAPSMLVKVPYFVAFGKGNLCSFERFKEKVQKECPNWKSDQTLEHYLNETVFPQLQNTKTSIKNAYECVVQVPIDPQHLDFEVIESTMSFDNYPYLEFNSPKELSSLEIGKLKIPYGSQYSEIEEYQDSRFEYTDGDETYLITRQKRTSLTEEEIQQHALAVKKSALRRAWPQRINQLVR